MKRLRRIIFNAITALSLLLCVGPVVLWVRSYLREDCLGWSNPDETLAVRSRVGLLEFSHSRILGSDPVEGFYIHNEKGFFWDRARIESEYEWMRYRGRRGWEWHGFAMYTKTYRATAIRGISIPYWL